MGRVSSLRIVTYNVHRCVGCDGQLSPARVARLLARLEPDLVALQELDVARARTGHADQPRVLAEYLRMQFHFHPAVRWESEHYGDAVLSRWPLEVVRAAALPTLPGRPWLERRGALWVRVDCGGSEVQVINTHLGLGRRERLAQVKALLGPEWLGNAACKGPRVLCGDFNTWPGTDAYRRLRGALGGQRAPNGEAGATFPSRWPLVRLDHVFLSDEWVVRAVKVPRDRLARVASDHLPLVVEAALA